MRIGAIPSVVVAALLLLALRDDNPLAYYRLLRIVCCTFFAYLTYRAIIEKRQGWPWVYGPAAYLFDPIVPVRLSRDRKRRG